jgi:hypothetical protein
MILTTLLLGVALLCFLLAGVGWLKNWIGSHSWLTGRNEWGEPVPGVLQKWARKIEQIRCRPPEFAKQRTRAPAPKPASPTPTAAPVEPPKATPQTAFPPFGATNGTPPKEGLVWNRTKEIE